MHLGPRQRQDEERRVRQVAQRRADEAERGQVSPLEILEHDQHRPRGALGGDEVLEGAAHLVAHQHRVAPRRAELHAGLVGEGDPRELAEELHHARRLVSRRKVSPGEGADLLPLHGGGLAVEHAGRAAERGGQHAEGGAGARGIALPEEHRRPRRAVLAEAVRQLAAQVRLAGSGRAGDQHRPRPALHGAVREPGAQARELGVPAEAGARAAEQRPAGVLEIALPGEHEAALVAPDHEARLPEPGRQIVDPDQAGRGGAQHPRRAVDHLADGELPRDHAAPGGQRHGAIRQRRAQGERAPGRSRCLIRRRPEAHQGSHHRPVRELLQVRPEGIEGARQSFHRRLRGLPVVRRGRGAGDGQREEALLLAPQGARAGRLHPAGQRHRPVDGGQRRRRRGPVARPERSVLGEHPRHQIVEPRRHVGPEVGDARRLLEEDLGEHPHRVLPGERRPPRQALVEHAPQGEHVDPGVEIALPPRLLGRHVPRRPHGVALVARPRRVAQRHPEVDEGGAPGRPVREEQVARLEIPVDHPSRVRRRQRLGHPPPERRRVADGEPPLPGQPGVEGLAVDPLHRQVERALRGVPVRHVAHHPGRVELGHDPRLFGEAGLGRGAVQDLERHPRVRDAVLGEVDHPRATRAGAPLDDESVGDDGPGAHAADRTTAPACWLPGYAERPQRRAQGEIRSSTSFRWSIPA